MTFEKLKDLIEKYNIPSNVKISSIYAFVLDEEMTFEKLKDLIEKYNIPSNVKISNICLSKGEK